MKAVQRKSIIDSRPALGLAIISVCLALVVVWVSFTPGVVGAAAPPLVVAKSASPEPVVAGETLTYIITVSNRGPTVLSGVVVSDTAPLQTTLLGTIGPDLWIMFTPRVGERRSAVWMAPAPLQPGQTVELAFKVQVAPSARGLVINDKYEAIAEGWDDAVRGEPVLTRIEVPTPTETPSPTPRLSPGLTPGPETRKEGTAARPAPTLTPTPVFSPTPGSERETGTAAVTSTPAPVPQSRRAGVGWWLVPLVFVVVVVVVAITWFIRVGRGGTDHEN